MDFESDLRAAAAATERIDAPLFRKLSAKGRSAVMELLAGGHYQLLDAETLAAMQAGQDALDVMEEAFDDAFDDEADAPELEIEVFEYAQAGEGDDDR